MTPSDPHIPIPDLARAIAQPKHAIWLWQAAGFIARPSKGHAPLFGTLRGVLDALRAEIADPAPYAIPEAAVVEAPSGHITLDVAEAALRRLAAKAEADLARLSRDRRKPLKGQIARQAASIRARIAVTDRNTRAVFHGAAILLEKGEAL